MANPTGKHGFLTPEQIQDMCEMARKGVPVYKIAAMFDIAPNTARFHIQKRELAKRAAERDALSVGKSL